MCSPLMDIAWGTQSFKQSKVLYISSDTQSLKQSKFHFVPQGPNPSNKARFSFLINTAWGTQILKQSKVFSLQYCLKYPILQTVAIWLFRSPAENILRNWRFGLWYDRREPDPRAGKMWSLRYTCKPYWSPTHGKAKWGVHVRPRSYGLIANIARHAGGIDTIYGYWPKAMVFVIYTRIIASGKRGWSSPFCSTLRLL